MAVSCVFCSLLRREIPGRIVFERGRIAAFLDLHPVAEGHVLLAPRDHFATWTDLPPDLAAELAAASQELARAVLRASGAEGFNLLMNNHACSGQAVAHAHLHVIPRRTGDGIRYQWPSKDPSPAELDRAAERLRAAF